MIYVELAGTQVAVDQLDDTNGRLPLAPELLRPGDELPMHNLELGGCTTAVFTGMEPLSRLRARMHRIVPVRKHAGRLVLGASIIGNLEDGSPVYMQHSHSHAITHFQADPSLYDSVPRALAQTAAPQEARQAVEFAFQEPVGLNELVEVGPDDKVFYATRPNRSVPIPFVEGRELEPSRFITLYLKTVVPATPAEGRPGCYELFSAFTGRNTPPLPNTEAGTKDPESIPFWSQHALVPRQAYDPATRTDVCPWPQATMLQ